MNGLKKLFWRDRVYWLIMLIILIWTGFYSMKNASLARVALEKEQYIREVWDAYPEHHDTLTDPTEVLKIKVWSDWDGIACDVWRFLDILILVLVVQEIKILFQKTKNRMEVYRVLPVKSRNELTYHYISGLILIGFATVFRVTLQLIHMAYVERTENIIFEQACFLWIGVLQAVILFMLQYSLLLCCRNLTNHITATVFTFIILDYAMMALVGAFLKMDLITAVASFYTFDIANILEDRPFNWVIMSAFTVVLILISYVADQKKDEACDGFYAFPVAHKILLCIVFVLGCYGFYGSFEQLPSGVAVLITIVAALTVTGGVFLLTRTTEPRKGKKE